MWRSGSRSIGPSMLANVIPTPATPSGSPKEAAAAGIAEGALRPRRGAIAPEVALAGDESHLVARHLKERPIPSTEKAAADRATETRALDRVRHGPVLPVRAAGVASIQARSTDGQDSGAAGHTGAPPRARYHLAMR